MKLSENFNLVYVLKPGDHNAGVDGDSIHGGKVKRTVTYLVQFASLTGGAVLKVFSGATAGAKTTAETFSYRLADAVQGSATADTFGDWATSAALTLVAATYQNKQMEVTVEMDAMTDGQPWITPELGSEASALNASINAVCEATYKAHDVPTVIS